MIAQSRSGFTQRGAYWPVSTVMSLQFLWDPPRLAAPWGESRTGVLLLGPSSVQRSQGLRASTCVPVDLWSVQSQQVTCEKRLRQFVARAAGVAAATQGRSRVGRWNLG